MRLFIVSALALAVSACGQQKDSNSAEAGGDKPAAGSLKLAANGVPQFRPGAWEVIEKSEKATETRRECLGAEADAQLREALTREYPKECKVERSSSSERVLMKASCKQDGLTIDTEIELKGSDTQFDTRMAAYVTTPDGKRSGGETTGSSRWVGECPAGVKPGETIEAKS